MKNLRATILNVAAAQAVAQSEGAHAHSILNQLPSSHLSRLMKAGRPRRLLRGEVLFHKGEPGNSCYWVMKGTLKVGVNSETGEERVFSLVGPGSVVGELAILDNLPRSATVTAVSDSNLTELKRAALMAYLGQHSNVYSDLIAILVGRLRKANDELSADSFLTVQARVARALLGLIDQVGEAGGPDLFILPATVSQSDIGAMAGVARESVSRTMSEWRRRGIVSSRPGKKLSVKRSKVENEAKPLP
jgi:CRP/FNR family cyclic AMP-dependent transcriptional regulator